MSNETAERDPIEQTEPTNKNLNPAGFGTIGRKKHKSLKVICVK